jgi:hypothetical protein
MRLVGIAVLALVAVGCGDERDAVLEVMERARDALVARDAETACGLVTARGRELALEFELGGSCEESVRAAQPFVIRDAERARFGEPEIDGDRATVDLESDGMKITFRIVETEDGWRIDDSDAVPQGEN